MGIMNFFGRSDKYAKNNKAIDIAYHNRCARSERNWKAYCRQRYESLQAPQQDKISDMGAVSSYIDRIVSFTHSSVWEYSLDFPQSLSEAQQAKVNELLEYVRTVQKNNPMPSISIELGYSCAVDGDFFIVPQPDSEDSLLRDYTMSFDDQINTNADMSIKFFVIKPLHVYDFVLAPDNRTMTYICLKFPVTKIVNGQRVDHIFKQEITPDTVVETIETTDGTLVQGPEERQNPVGVVYAIHAKNYPIPSKWGLDDVDGLLDVSDEINKKIHNISNIIDYHEEPTIAIFGARAKSIEKGVRKVWAGFPANAKIEVIKNEADLEASVKFLEQLKQSLQQQSGVNDAALGSEDLVSNVSGSAMQLRFYPLISKAALKWASWDAAIRDLAKMVLLWGRVLNHINFEPGDLRNLLNSLEITFKSNLPTNEKEDIQNSTNKLHAGITTFARELRRMGDRNPGQTLDTLEAELKARPVLMGMLGMQNIVTSQAEGQERDKRSSNTAPDGTPVDPPDEVES